MTFQIYPWGYSNSGSRCQLGKEGRQKSGGGGIRDRSVGGGCDRNHHGNPRPGALPWHYVSFKFPFLFHFRS